MKSAVNKFSIHYLLLWFLVLLNYLGAALFAFSKGSVNDSPMLTGFFIGILVVTWLLFISDVISNKIFNKTYWIVLIVFGPMLVYPFYLVQRKRLIDIELRKERFNQA